MKYSKEEIIVFLKQHVRTIALAFLSSIIIVFGIFYFLIKSNPASEPIENYVIETTAEKEDSVEEKVENKETATVFVDIKGAVKKPGVYELTKEERIFDVLEKAGGVTEEADTSAINLSQKVRDQMMIVVPKVGEKVTAESATSPETNNKLININTASKEELMQISGIGESKAKAIIGYRENKGEFKTKEGIMKVKGIGKGIFEKIKDEIDV